jgi:antitoxin component of MazEF toxin-antitoxin module
MKATVKKWGNSLGIILPKEIVKERNLKENSEVEILIAKEKPNLDEIYRLVKKRRMSGQKMKDEARKGWN